MLKTYLELENFRANCVLHPRFDYFDAYDELLHEDNDWDNDLELYDLIEKNLLDWLKKNAKHDVYYGGDLRFEFESQEECDRFDEECGDPVAFKLTWT